MKKLMMAVMVAALGLSAAAAYTPSFAYQGVLRDEKGDPLTGTESATIEFKIYKSANGADYLWSKSFDVDLAANGLFNVELAGNGLSSDGTSTTLDKVAADNSNADLYIGLTVSGSAGEISPRQKLISAPRAIFAHDVNTAQGDFTVKGDLTVAGAINMGSTNDTLSVANIWATGALTANKAATFKDGAQVEAGGLKVVGDTEVSGNLTVGGSAVSMPIGAIMMWSGAATANDLPKDGCWKLCDGQGMYAFNGDKNDMRPIPDLRGRFIVGAVGDGTTSVTVEGESVNYVTGNKGGKNKVALTTEELPSHSHSISTGSLVAKDPSSGSEITYLTTGSDKSHTSSATGSGQAHENCPPYYTLCFIIKVK